MFKIKEPVLVSKTVNATWIVDVDVPRQGPLSLRSEDLYKKRFNVAASRARDQMWVIYSLAGCGKRQKSSCPLGVAWKSRLYVDL